MIDEKRFMRLENLVMAMNERLKGDKEEFLKEMICKQKLWGHIHILEEQQEIMHNFLVEINKYLANLADKDKK